MFAIQGSLRSHIQTSRVVVRDSDRIGKSTLSYANKSSGNSLSAALPFDHKDTLDRVDGVANDVITAGARVEQWRVRVGCLFQRSMRNKRIESTYRACSKYEGGRTKC